jgi:UDP-4-amino-4-deoxy-L-arabinose-oxoglutarate aminotransferase
MSKVEFYRHSLAEEDIQAVADVLRTVFLTTGPQTSTFETAFAEYLGVSNVVALSSCTSALFLSLHALGIDPGDEVITTPMTFIATANTILHSGATPVFVDVEPATGNIDARNISAAITPRTRAILPVHLYGAMADMRCIMEIARAHSLEVVEDAAHAVEPVRDGARPGQLGRTACFSFYATKNMTCGEGGAVATNDSDLAERLKRLRSHGMSKSAAERYTGRYQHWDMLELGFKANLPDILSALLIRQIPRLDAQLARREAIARQYESAFLDLDGLDFPRVPQGARSARHLFTVWVPPRHRDDTLAFLQQRGIGVAVNYRAVHLLTYYRERFGYKPGDFPIAEQIGDRTVTLPLYPGMTDAAVQSVIDAVREAAARW